MPSDAFLHLTGIDGDTKDPTHSGALEIEHNWNWSIHQAGTQHHFGGGGEGKAHVGDFSCTPRMDSAAAAILAHVQKGDHIDECKLVQRQAGGKQQEFLKLTMKKCLVTTFGLSGGSGVSVSLSLNFEEYKLEVAPQLDDGELGAVKEFGYNIAKNEVA